jgi:hypothetical protein
VPLADDAWVGALERTDAALFTLDHLGYAQRQRIVAFGPPHMTFSMEVTPTLPANMQVLLPCPINDPELPDRRPAIPRGLCRRFRSRSAPGARAYLVDEEGSLVATALGWVHLARTGPHYRFRPSCWPRCLQA